jgi:hypothetical protein
MRGERERGERSLAERKRGEEEGSENMRERGYTSVEAEKKNILNGSDKKNKKRTSAYVERYRVTSFKDQPLKVRFNHHIFPTNLMTNSLTKSRNKQMSHIFFLFVSQKFVANQIGLLQTH